MRIRTSLLCLFSLLLLMVAAGCSKPEAPKQEAPPPAAPAAAAPAAGGAADGKSLFDQKCSVCHGLDRATARSESKEKWAEIVKTMQGKKADWISDTEAQKIVDYLASEHGKK